MRLVGLLGVGLLLATSVGCAGGSGPAGSPTGTSPSTVEPPVLEIPQVTDPLAGMDCGGWAMATIDGYPVIRANDEATARHGFCRLFVGVADDATVSIVDVRLGLAADEADCGRADRAAGMILATLRP